MYCFGLQGSRFEGLKVGVVANQGFNWVAWIVKLGFGFGAQGQAAILWATVLEGFSNPHITATGLRFSCFCAFAGCGT